MLSTNTIKSINLPTHIFIKVAKRQLVIYVMHVPFTFQLIVFGSFPPQHFLLKTSTTAITLSLTILTSTILSHSYSSMTPTPPTQSPFQSTTSLISSPPTTNLFPSITNILAPYPLHVTFCKQHTSLGLFLSSSQTFLSFPLRLPIFLIPILPHSADLAFHHIASIPAQCRMMGCTSSSGLEGFCQANPFRNLLACGFLLLDGLQGSLCLPPTIIY